MNGCSGKISICIYLTERSFIKKLYGFYGEKIFENISETIIPEPVNIIK